MITVAGFQQDLAAQKRHRDAKAREREALTAAHVADQAATAAECAGEGRCEAGPVPDEAARKSIPGLEAEAGPGSFREPGEVSPGDFRRPYLDSGHSAPSPMHGAPNVAPLPPAQPGVLMPVQMPSAPEIAGHNGPVVQAMAAHQARAMVSMPQPRGQ